MVLAVRLSSYGCSWQFKEHALSNSWRRFSRTLGSKLPLASMTR